MSSLLVSPYGPTQNRYEKFKTLATLIIYSESCVVALFKIGEHLHKDFVPGKAKLGYNAAVITNGLSEG